jgi:hypothetical protein
MSDATDNRFYREKLEQPASNAMTQPAVLPMECGSIYAKVVVVNGIICIREESEDHESEVYMEYDEARAMRDWLNKVLS